MAIQHRRGNYADLDTSKLVQGEPFVTLDKVNGDYYAGIAIAPNNVIRFATWNNLVDIRTACEQYRDQSQSSASSASTSESNSEAWAVGERGSTPVPSTDITYENNSKYYAGMAHDYWDLVDAAVSFITPSVSMNFVTGELEITGTTLVFSINTTTGNLEWDIGHS